MAATIAAVPQKAEARSTSPDCVSVERVWEGGVSKQSKA